MKKGLSIIFMVLALVFVFVSCDDSTNDITGTRVVTDASSLKDAIADESVKTIYLGADINLTEKIEIGDSKDITLDMNGKTINEDLGEGKNAGIITVAGNGKLKITGNGKISHTQNYYKNGSSYGITGYLITAMDSAELTIENGSFYAVMGCVRGGRQRETGEESYKIDIKGGEFESIEEYGGRYWTLNKMDKNSGVKDGTLSVSGGSFVNFNPEKPATNDTPCYLAEGYRVTSETKDSKTIYTVSAKTTE